MHCWRGFLRREMDGFDARAGDAHHFAGLDFADVLGVEQIERASFRGDEPNFAARGQRKFTEHKRTEAARIAHGVEFVLRQNEQRVRAFDLIECVAQRAGKIARLRPSDEMHDHFGVAVGLEN